MTVAELPASDHGPRRGERGRSRWARAGFLLFAIFLALPCGSAVADTGHGFVAALTEAPAGTPISEPVAVAVDHSTGDTFVADAGGGEVDVFTAGGSYVTQFGEELVPSGVAVDEASGDVYLTSGDVVVVFKPTGTGAYELLSRWSGGTTPEEGFGGEVAGVAFDNSTSASDPHAGDVFVVDAGTNSVDVFEPMPAGADEAQEGMYVGALQGGRLEEPNGVAVDSATGDVYVADGVKGQVDVYSSAGLYERKLTGDGSPSGSFLGPEDEEGNVSAVAVEEGTGDVFVAEAERHVVSQLSEGGEWLGWITMTPSGQLSEPFGVALTASGDVEVADAGASAVDVFGPGVLVPDAKTSSASKVGKTTVVLGGVVNGEGRAAKYHFEWGESEAYGSQTPDQVAGSGEEKVQAEMSGLAPATTYHFRLVTENENGVNVGTDREFTTLPAVEALSTGPAQNVTATSATLTGSLTPKGAESYYYFQWGTSASYGNFSPAPPGFDAGTGNETVAAETQLSGLLANTTYHYRLVATDSYGTTYGEDARFTTAGPPRITSEPPSEVGHQAATLNANIDPGERESSYSFQYGETTGYGSETAPGKLTAGEAFTPVVASLGGLKLGAVYHYRVVASNSISTTYGPDQTFETVPSALIEGTAATGVGSSEAVIEADVNPLGSDTTVYFQYGTGPCKPDPSQCTSVPAPPGEDIGSGEAALTRSERLSGLQAGTTYYYRALAVNGLGTSEGRERVFTTGPTPSPPFALADNRAWEMVTPPDKHGAPVEALTSEGGIILAAEDGDVLTYVANGPLSEAAEGNRSPEMQQVIAMRTSEGWSSQDVATPSTRAQGTSASNAPEYQFFTPDLAYALVEPWGTTALSEPPLAPDATQKTMYLREDATGGYLPLVTEANVPVGTEFGGKLHFLSATPDLSHVVLRSAVSLTGPSSGKGLYEWSEGSLQFVSLLPSGSPASEAELGFDDHLLARAVSNDGTRVVWTSKDENSGSGHLYMRDTATGETVELDAAQGASEPATGSAQFQTASADGSKVFFTDTQKLTAESSSEPSHGEADLYECEMLERAGKLACDLKDLTSAHQSGEAAAVQGLVLGAGEDGEQVYLVAQGVLASNENGQGEVAQAGHDNLYELHETGQGATGGEWTSTFIGQLASEDSHEWEGNKGEGDAAFLTARVSPNGQYLAFMSAAILTGFDNTDTNPRAGGAHDEEVYLYDAQTATLTCVSCNPSGARPAGVYEPVGADGRVEAGEGAGLLVDRREIWRDHWLAGSIPGWTAQSLTSALYQSRYLSNEGRLFFDSADPLVPQVTTPTREETIEGERQQVGAENVYEYEPSGAGSCQSPSGGCVSLISSGASPHESAFLEATPSGNDVFFLTDAQLLPQDTDTAFDIYDARVCTTASPCLTPPALAPAGCSDADACRPAQPASQSPIGPSGTATFSGSGDVAAAKRAVLPEKASKPRARPLSKLATALATCRKRYPRSRHKRARCEAQARHRYAPKHKANKRSHRASTKGTRR
jgi:hypothetical protein